MYPIMLTLIIYEIIILNKFRVIIYYKVLKE